MKNKTPFLFLFLAITALLLGIAFGLLASFQYISADFLKDIIPFNKLRPFHVTSVISWIILSATGGIYYYLSEEEKLPIYSPKLMKSHFMIFLFTGIAIYVSFLSGNMQGREYLAYAPILTIPILIAWILFGVNYFKTLVKQASNWPVFYWMWGTGIVFMIYHLSEAHLWVLPYFREQAIKDLAIQWKSYGSFVGSWNMLVYGTAIYIMSKIKNDDSIARGRTVFFFYFLGLTNLMFGWAHHTYIVPTMPWIRYVAYGISMTEWVVLAHIIYVWKKSLSSENKSDNSMAFKFLMTADFWIFTNLILALLFSIPTINFFTHGTHITVAHSMGTTIGINTSILLASVFFILSRQPKLKLNLFVLKRGHLLYRLSLLLFWISLLAAGVRKSHWMYFSTDVLFSSMQQSLSVVYILIFTCGIFLVISFWILAVPILKALFTLLRTESDSNDHISN